MMADDDLFSDSKGHRIDTFFRCTPSENVQDIRETAAFIRQMEQNLKRSKRFRLSKDIFIYIAFIAIFSYLFFFVDLGSIGKTTTIVRHNITEVPRVDEGIKMSAGRVQTVYSTLGDWWNLSLNTSCRGIDEYYSGSGFMGDWMEMMDAYNKIYTHDRDEPAGIIPPFGIAANSTNYDCEDFAHATRCLSEKYGVECSFWMKSFIGAIVPAEGGHLGVCCRDNGGWKCV